MKGNFYVDYNFLIKLMIQYATERVVKMSKAKEWITEGMTACLPDDYPLPFNKILNAKFKNKKEATATVELFDQKTGIIKIGKRSTWSIQWLELTGGSINWNGDFWERVQEIY